MERGLEFYVMLAAVAVGALTWLYRKGSRVWRTVRKLRRSFQEICLNPKSTLADEPCRQLAIGAMYASQQGAWQNSLETGISDTLPEILGGWWGIDSTAEARTQLDYLCEKGFRYYWPTVLEAFRLDDRLRQDALFQQLMLWLSTRLMVRKSLRRSSKTCGRPSTNSSRAAWSPRRKNSAAAT